MRRPVPRINPKIVRVIAPLVFGVVLVTGWQITVTISGLPKTILPSPGAVAMRLVSDLTTGQLLYRTAFTVAEALLGCALATVIALPLGYIVARWWLADATVSPYLAASQAVPAVAIAPLLAIWLGYGMPPTVVLCALVVFFPMLLTTVLGLKQINQRILDAAALDGASGWRLIWLIQWPLARRSVLTGLRNGFTLSITGAVVGEFVMGGQGLGMIVSVQSANSDTTGLFATICVLCIMAVAIYFTILLIDHFSDPLREPHGHSHLLKLIAGLPEQVRETSSPTSR
jgi:NitT/TauT family transport system permease protein